MPRKMSILDVLAEFGNLQERVIAVIYRESVLGLVLTCTKGIDWPIQ